MSWVYMLRCSDGTIYVGSTNNLQARMKEHADGVASSHTAKRRPVRLIYQEHVESALDGVRRERQLKRWSGEKKAALARGDCKTLKQLSRRRRAKKMKRPCPSFA